MNKWPERVKLTTAAYDEMKDLQVWLNSAPDWWEASEWTCDQICGREEEVRNESSDLPPGFHIDCFDIDDDDHLIAELVCDEQEGQVVVRCIPGLEFGLGDHEKE